MLNCGMVFISHWDIWVEEEFSLFSRAQAILLKKNQNQKTPNNQSYLNQEYTNLFSYSASLQKWVDVRNCQLTTP